MNNYDEITVISDSSSEVYSKGIIGFTADSTSYSVSMESVANNSGNSLALELSDFDYNESTKELTLTSSGLIKFQNASASLTAKEKYQYTITFKLLDYDSGKDTTIDVPIYLIKAEVITKAKIEEMIKSVKYSNGGNSGDYAPNNSEIVFSEGNVPTRFNFSSVSFSSSTPSFSLTGNTDFKEGKTYASYSIEITARNAAHYIVNAITQTAPLFRTYFGRSHVYGGDYDAIDSLSTLPSISSSKKECTFTLKFKYLKSGYASSKEVAHLTTTGLTIKLTVKDGTTKNLTGQEKNYTVIWQ